MCQISEIVWRTPPGWKLVCFIFKTPCIVKNFVYTTLVWKRILKRLVWLFQKYNFFYNLWKCGNFSIQFDYTACIFTFVVTDTIWGHLMMNELQYTNLLRHLTKTQSLSSPRTWLRDEHWTSMYGEATYTTYSAITEKNHFPVQSYRSVLHRHAWK